MRKSLRKIKYFLKKLGKAKITDNTEITIVIEKSYDRQIYRSPFNSLCGGLDIGRIVTLWTLTDRGKGREGSKEVSPKTG